MAALFDRDSMELYNSRDEGSGVVWSRGRIEGVPAIAFCTDATKMGGAMGVAGCVNIVDAIDTALRERVPCIGIWHCGGARLAEGVVALDGVGKVFASMVNASGKIPQISVVLGPAAGGAAYGPALTDVVVMSASGRVFVTGPEVVRSVTGEQVDMEQLGGPDTHGRKSGVVHITTDSDQSALQKARDLASLLGDQGRFDLAKIGEPDDVSDTFPAEARRAYDVKPMIRRILDNDFLEIQAKWSPNVVIGLGRMGGRSVGIVANNPIRMGGCLTAQAAEKAARFVRMCDAFGIPLAVIVDVPGYLPGVGQEWDGVVRRGAKLLHAFAECVVPRVTLVTRKLYGGAYIAMNSKSLGATNVFAWPTAEVAVMGAKAAVGILHRKTLAAAPVEEREALQDKLAAEHEKLAGGIERAIEIGVVDRVINPADTRSEIIQALASRPGGRGMHGNIPL
ncbi:MAG: carboxyl transferase domain-containing protein [Antricoccus sp.]